MGSPIELRRIALAGVLLAACGGAAGQPAGSGDPGPTAAQRARAAERAEAARLALVEGDLPHARREATAALTLDPAEPAAREVAARVGLAEGRHDDVIAVLEGARRPRLVRLRARAHVRLGNLASAASDLASVEERPPGDGWAEAILPIARASAGVAPYEVQGDDVVTLALDPRAPVPVIEIDVDGRSLHALVATSADTTVIDDDVRATAGMADRIAFDSLSVANVPVLSRDLGDISATLGVDLGAVIGTDLLLRLVVTIDGRERRLVLRQRGFEPSADSASVSFATFEGSFLAVPATVNDDASGWYTLDTSGLFPVALGPLGLEALELDPAELEPAPGAPSDEVRMTTLESIRIGDMQMEGVPAVTGIFPADLSELAGAPISGIVGAAVTHQLRVTIDPESRRLYIE